MSSENDLLDRRPPMNQEAERCVLGSMLKENSKIDEVLNVPLRKEDFYADAHQKIFEVTVALNDRGGQPVDPVILAEELSRRGWLEDAGGYGYLAELWDSIPTAANVEYYARIVREKSLLRHLILTGTEVLTDAYKQEMPADQVIETAQRKIFDLAEKGLTSHLTTLAEAIDETYDRIDSRHKGEEMAHSGLSTGFADLNELTAGLQRSELVIIAARPSVGKTAFATSVIRNIITGERQPVFFISLEQSRVEIAERLLCSHARVDSHRLRKGTLTSEDMEKLIEAGGTLRAAGKLFIDDTPAQGMLRIAANARRLKRAHGIRLVVIDYLQLIEPENRRDPRQEQVAQISRRLKFLARELEVPVVALAQVNRASEDRQDHRPRLSDLRESGCLAGDSLVTLVDGSRVPIRDLVGRSGLRVWTLDEESLKLQPAEVSNAFCTGRKPVYRLQTRRGRSIRATANHRFRGFEGWQRLDELSPGQHLALPCTSEARSASEEPEHLGWARPLTQNRADADRSEPRPLGSGLRSPFPYGRGSDETAAAGPCMRDEAGLLASASGFDLPANDVFWDEVARIEPAGEEDVFDLTVPGPANFVANDIIVHNSIEQDADAVFLLHRPDRYEPGQHEGIIEIIVAKNRNGPVGEITLAYAKQYMRYEDFKPGTPFDS
jgi:replicative DNA helicase